MFEIKCTKKLIEMLMETIIVMRNIRTIKI